MPGRDYCSKISRVENFLTRYDGSNSFAIGCVNLDMIADMTKDTSIAHGYERKFTEVRMSREIL